MDDNSARPGAGAAGHRLDRCLNDASPAGDALERAILLACEAPDRLGGIKDRVEAWRPEKHMLGTLPPPGRELLRRP